MLPIIVHVVKLELTDTTPVVPGNITQFCIYPAAPLQVINKFLTLSRTVLNLTAKLLLNSTLLQKLPKVFPSANKMFILAQEDLNVLFIESVFWFSPIRCSPRKAPVRR